MTKIFGFRIVALVCVLNISLFMFSSCGNKPKEVKDYPTTSLVTYNLPEDETKEIDDDYFSAERYYLSNDKPFDVNGRFVYNPVAFRPGIRENAYMNKPIVVALAYEMMRAVDQCATSMDFPYNVKIEQRDFEDAYDFAKMNNPLIYDAVFSSEDYIHYDISYFDFFGSFDDSGNFDYEAGSENSDVSEQIEDFKDYISKTINDNVTEYDSDMEKARKIYKHMIETYKIVDQQIVYIDQITEVEPGQSAALVCIDVLRHYDKKELNISEFIKLYQFFLTQLDIPSTYQLACGQCISDEYKDKNIHYYDTDFSQLDCIVIIIGEEGYLCNIYFEALDYAKETSGGRICDCECKYFGLCKNTFNRTFKIDYLCYLGDMDPVFFDFEDPKEDYVHEIK
ncbi:MAG: hypothetical protein J5856_06650 [Lachnospiraceae bacterium]|nr:hypothetical protein [Lachnospiraceae bacterium]